MVGLGQNYHHQQHEPLNDDDQSISSQNISVPIGGKSNVPVPIPVAIANTHNLAVPNNDVSMLRSKPNATIPAGSFNPILLPLSVDKTKKPDPVQT